MWMKKRGGEKSRSVIPRVIQKVYECQCGRPQVCSDIQLEGVPIEQYNTEDNVGP